MRSYVPDRCATSCMAVEIIDRRKMADMGGILQLSHPNIGTGQDYVTSTDNSQSC